MIKIAHRGNYQGRNADLENNPAYLSAALAAGYNVEVDAWRHEGRWYLGHDKPEHMVSIDFLCHPHVWTHAKNFEGYLMLYPNKDVHVFWHNKDDFVFTSKGIKWANTGIDTHDGIMVMPDANPELCWRIRKKEITPLGVCSDDFRIFEPDYPGNLEYSHSVPFL